MNPDELEERLRRLDPADGAPVDPVNGPRAAALLEQIMDTNTDDVRDVVPTPSRRPRRFLALGLGAAAVVAVGVFALTVIGGDDPAPTQVSFALGASDPMAMCLPVSEIQPDASASAFRGTVVEVGEGTVTLDVTKWYQNGDADQVVLTTTDLATVALDGVDFAAGGDYLVSALDGQVGICGLSGVYSPELEALFDGWYGA